MKFVKSIPRKPLLWLTENQITRFRHDVIKLYLGPTDRIAIAAPRKVFGISKLTLSGGSIPQISYQRESGVRDSFWLQFPSNRLPCWDMQRGDGLVFRLPFSHKEARVVSQLVKHYCEHFPFAATDNFLQNGGAFVG